MDRDLDADIAQHIFGWLPVFIGEDFNGENNCEVLTPSGVLPKGFTFPNIGKVHRGFLVPSYTSDLRQALLLALSIIPETKLKDLPIDPDMLSRVCYGQWKIQQENRTRKLENQ
jgi:hypothetical protein